MSGHAPLLQVVQRTRASFLNLFWHNDKARWDRSYQRGHWSYLDSAQQGPRHHVIGDLLRGLGDDASSVLDVGCGTGALVPYLPETVSRYVGIDISGEAVRLCRERVDTGPDVAFLATSFDEYVPVGDFRVVVFNEMLYYYPLRRISGVIDRALGLLPRRGGTIIVSIHDRSLKRRALWRRLRARLSPTKSLRAAGPGTRTSWRIEQYNVTGIGRDWAGDPQAMKEGRS